MRYVCREDVISEVLYPALGTKAPRVDVDALFEATFSRVGDGPEFQQTAKGEEFWTAVEDATY